MPKVSFIMPAYNAGKFIRQAIASVIAQTFGDWELIVVDDASTDNTLRIAEEMADTDSRIRILHRATPSGSAFRARLDGIKAAESELISPLDADDAIPTDYLESLLHIKESTHAAAVYPLIYLSDGPRLSPFINPDSYVSAEPMPGCAAVRLTLNGWSVTCNGGLIDKSLYEKAFKEFGEDHTDICADETLTRVILSLAPEVVFTSEVKYIYRVNEASVTHSPSPRRVERLVSCCDVCEIIEKDFGKGSEEYRLAHLQLFNTALDSILYVYQSGFKDKSLEKAVSLIEKAKATIDREAINGDVRKHLTFILDAPFKSGGRLLELRERLKKGKATVSTQIRRPLRKYRYLRDRWFEKRRFHKELENLRHGILTEDSESGRFYRENYPEPIGKPTPATGETIIICPFDGRLYHGGTTDRIRGLLSTYAEAKRRDIPFRISWTSPFRLEDYLVPATFDWRIDPSEVHHIHNLATPVIIQDKDNLTSSEILNAALDGLRGEIHVYSNADSSIGRYHELYRELFRPSPRLEKSIETHRRHLGANYWAFHLRFLQLLGDFKDWDNEVLPEEEAVRLMEGNRDEILKIIKDIPEGYGIFVTSDSRRFLDFIADADPRIYIIPGEIRNIDLTDNEKQDTWLKAFTDQQLLMDARRVYRLSTYRMYPSGFSRFAAEVGGAEFFDHKF